MCELAVDAFIAFAKERLIRLQVGDEDTRTARLTLMWDPENTSCLTFIFGRTRLVEFVRHEVKALRSTIGPGRCGLQGMTTSLPPRPRLSSSR